MLHPRIGRHDKKAESHDPETPRTGEPMPHPPQPLLAKQKYSQKTRFQKKRKYSLHRQRLPDHSACRSRKRRQFVRIEIPWDSRDYAQRKINSENARPKPCRAIVVFVSGA